MALDIKILDPDPSSFHEAQMKCVDDASVSSTIDNSVSSGHDDSLHESSSPRSSSPKLQRYPLSEMDLKKLNTNPKLFAISGGVNTCKNNPPSFARFRWQYLLAYIGIMLADGLQGTHLYVLYEGYGYSVASLYSLGFVSGAFSSPFTGAFVDKFGRKKAAIVYCLLEIAINYMEQYPILIGLVLSRVIGGITTNLLCSCFETWLVTEHRKRGFSEDKLEIILRDSGVVSNSAAILSGFLAHSLASAFGPVGPFQGAVTATFFALVLVASLWTENFGVSGDTVLSFREHIDGAFKTIAKDSKISRVGLIQGLVEGSLQTFVFLWSPALRSYAESSPPNAIGLDEHGQPAYGLIFGAFMSCAVLGGFVAPVLRACVSRLLTRCGCLHGKPPEIQDRSISHDEGLGPLPINILCSVCYLVGAALLFIPCAVPKDSPWAFSLCFASFMLYEFVVGVYVPSEGVVRSIYMPSESMCSIINILRIITNVAVALGVFSTTFVPLKVSFAALSSMMIAAALLQLSLIPYEELERLSEFILGHLARSFPLNATPIQAKKKVH